MDIYAKSIRYLKRKLRKEDITKEEWDEYAHENYLFSALTLIDKKKVGSFEELKQKVKKEKEENFLYNQDIYIQIRNYQTKLNRIVEKKRSNRQRSKSNKLKNR